MIKMISSLPKIFISTTLFTLVIFSGSVYAQSKVGVVNVQVLLKESKAAIAATRKLEQEFSARDQELQRLSKQLQQLQETFDKNSATMSEADKRKKEGEFADLNREFQRKGRELREDLERRQSEETAKILERAQAEINQIAEQDKFDLILRDAVYVAPNSDITDRVLKSLE